MLNIWFVNSSKVSLLYFLYLIYLLINNQDK